MSEVMEYRELTDAELDAVAAAGLVDVVVLANNVANNNSILNNNNLQIGVNANVLGTATQGVFQAI